MNKNLDKAIKKYMQATKRLLICPKDYRSQFIDDMKRDMEHFIQESEPKGYSDITCYFGTPAELAQTYLDSVPKDELAKYKIKRKAYITIMSIILVTFLIETIVFSGIKLSTSRKLEKFYIHESMEVLEKIQNDNF